MSRQSLALSSTVTVAVHFLHLFRTYILCIMNLNLTNYYPALCRCLAGLCIINCFHHFPSAKKSGYCFPEKKTISHGITFDWAVQIHPRPSWRDRLFPWRRANGRCPGRASKAHNEEHPGIGTITKSQWADCSGKGERFCNSVIYKNAHEVSSLEERRIRGR